MKKNIFALICLLIIPIFISCNNPGVRRAAFHAAQKAWNEADFDSDEDEDEDEGSNVSFKGRTVVVDPDYGYCFNDDCDCEQYAHYPGQTACVNCAKYGCTTNKFGHSH